MRDELRSHGWCSHDLQVLRWPRVVHAYAVCSNRQSRPVIHHVRHSMSGFEFGYEGSGPADLARSLLIDWFDLHGLADRGDGTPLPVCYRRFERAFIARVPREAPHFWIAAASISAWIERECPGTTG